MQVRFNHFLAVLLAICLAVGVYGMGAASPETTATFWVTNTNDSGSGSLRQALLDANASAATQIYVNFNIPGAAPHVIQTLTRLPDIDPGIEISALTQPDADCSVWPPTLTVVLKPANPSAGGSPGLFLNSQSKLQGLVIQGFTVGVEVWDSNNTLWCNFIGTNPAGTASVGNGAGVEISNGGTGNVIGGLTPTTRNLISGNGDGIQIGPGATGNTVWGNYIGTQVNGTGSLPNSGVGIRINGALHNLIGGSTISQGNVIAFNGAEGIRVSHQNLALTIDNTISHNLIFGNDKLPVDLGSDGVTANDAGDADYGDNNLQNYPDSMTAVRLGASMMLTGKLQSQANNTYQLEFYRSQTCNVLGHGDAQTFVGTLNVTTAANGQVQFATLVNYAGSGFISATATDLSSGDTSEFSICTAIQAGSAVFLPILRK